MGSMQLLAVIHCKLIIVEALLVCCMFTALC